MPVGVWRRMLTARTETAELQSSDGLLLPAGRRVQDSTAVIPSMYGITSSEQWTSDSSRYLSQLYYPWLNNAWRAWPGSGTAANNKALVGA